MTHKSGIEDRDAELVEMIAEEAGEIVQACMKLLRHGPYSVNPDDPDAGNNRHQLTMEIAQLNGTVAHLLRTGFLDHFAMAQEEPARYNKIMEGRAYTHHQNVAPPPKMPTTALSDFLNGKTQTPLCPVCSGLGLRSGVQCAECHGTGLVMRD